MSTSYNGGRTVMIGGVAIKIIDGYNPSWTKEYKDSFVTWDGRTVKPCTGIRFGLSISSHGQTAEQIEAVRAAISQDEINLVCDEFSGMVSCDDFSPQLTNSNIYCEYLRWTLNLTAVTAVVPKDSGGL